MGAQGKMLTSRGVDSLADTTFASPGICASSAASPRQRWGVVSQEEDNKLEETVAARVGNSFFMRIARFLSKLESKSLHSSRHSLLLLF